jgi:acyl carrier protein
MNEPFTSVVKRMIVDALMLEDIEPAEIVDEAALFGDGLGLDSIDALELAIAIDKMFGVKIESTSEQNREIFRNVSSLAAHIALHKTRG